MVNPLGITFTLIPMGNGSDAVLLRLRCIRNANGVSDSAMIWNCNDLTKKQMITTPYN